MARFLKPKGLLTARRGFAYAPAGVAPEADAPRYTREAEAQDIYGKARPALRVRVAPEDSTLVAGVPSEAVAPYAWARKLPTDPILAEAVRAWLSGDWESEALPE